MRNRNHTDGENIQCFAFGCVREVLVENGQMLGRLGDGRLVPRKIDPLILRRPAS